MAKHCDEKYEAKSDKKKEMAKMVSKGALDRLRKGK